MMKIIRKRQSGVAESFSLFYEYVDERNAGCAFDCDERGHVNVDELHPAAWANMWQASWSPAYRAPRVQRFATRWYEPAIGQCGCGREVALRGFTNTCQCGADYNQSGQRLAAREGWGEETGETAADILSV